MSEPFSEEYWQLLASASTASSSVLLALEELRRHYQRTGDAAPEWAVVLLERLACAFELGSPEHLLVHKVFVDAFTHPRELTPPPAATLAWDVLHEED